MQTSLLYTISDSERDFRGVEWLGNEVGGACTQCVQPELRGIISSQYDNGQKCLFCGTDSYLAENRQTVNPGHMHVKQDYVWFGFDDFVDDEIGVGNSLYVVEAVFPQDLTYQDYIGSFIVDNQNC